jgi:ABC-2 type transport system permease protein
VTGLLAVFRREMRSLWVTPLAWVVLVVFLVLQGMSFFWIVRHLSSSADLSVDSGPLQSYFGQSSFLLVSLLLLCPALTMRLFAEEKRSGTIEALLTAPVTPTAVVLGKYLAVVTTYAAMWAPTLLYAFILRHTGQVDWPVVGVSYLGVIGIGAGYLSIGTLMSAMTRSQLVAVLLTTVVIFGLFIFGIGEYIFDPGPLRDVCAHVSVFTQMEELSRGIVDLRYLVLDATLVSLPIFVTVRVVDSWRWG